VGGDLFVSPSAIDFGDVALGKELSTSVELHNDGIKTLTVETIPGIDPAFTISGLPVKLLPGQIAKVGVRYQPPALGSSRQTMALISDAPDVPRSDVDLRGHAVKGLAQISGDVIDFGDVVVSELSTQTVSLVNNDGHATTSVTIDCPQGRDASVFHCARQGTVPMRPEEQISVRVDFTPDRLGVFTGRFQITPCPTCSPRDIALAGRGVDKLIVVDPASIDFGDVLLAADASKRITVTNTSKSKLTISAVSLSGGPDLSVALDNAALPYTMAPGEVLTGAAHFKPRALGAQSSVASLAASDGGPGLVSMTGLGMGPVVQVVPKTYYLGATATGTTRSGTITVTNVGLDPHQIAPLQLSSISIVTADPAWSVTPASASVGEPGSRLPIQISFSPVRGGYSDAKLVIVSNDGTNPRLEVPMTALGRDLKPCAIAVKPGNPVDFGAVQLFHPSVQGFELVNQTGDDCIIGDPVLAGAAAFRWPGGITPSGRTLPVGGRMSVRIEFVPEALQTYSGSVQFYLSNRSAPTLTVGLQGAGDSSCFFLTPGAVDFGGVTQGCSPPAQYAYAVNQCARPVTVTDLRTTGAPFFISQAVPVTVQPQSNLPIAVSYQAATPGDDVGSLSVTTSMGPTRYQIGLTAGTQTATTVTDQWDQSTPKVDLLMVIDNSGSMDDEQQALQKNLDHLWSRIAIANADFHIAITTTGMEPYTQGWTQCPGGASGGEAGRFFPVDNSRPRLLTPQTPNVKDVLFANTNVGLCHWDEKFLEPTVAALTDPLIHATKAPGTPWPADGNAGFLRDDARLAILAISDTDDADDVPAPKPPIGPYVQAIWGAKHGVRDLVSFAGIVPLHNCPSIELLGVRYMEIAQMMNGKLFDICDLNNFGPMLESALGDLLLPLTSFPLSTHPRDPAAIAVTVNGAAVTNWSYDAATNRIVFPAASVPAPGSHITAQYQPACR
jgi:hypothetical protein